MVITVPVPSLEINTEYLGSIPGSVVLEDGTLLGPEEVEVDFTPDLTRFCFCPTRGMLVAKPKGIAHIRLAYELLMSTAQNGHSRQESSDFSFPSKGSSSNRIASVYLSASELKKMIWPKWEKVFQDFLRNKNFDRDEMTLLTFKFHFVSFPFPFLKLFCQVLS